MSIEGNGSWHWINNWIKTNLKHNLSWILNGLDLMAQRKVKSGMTRFGVVFRFSNLQNKNIANKKIFSKVIILIITKLNLN